MGTQENIISNFLSISLYLGRSILAGQGSEEAEGAPEMVEGEPDLEPVEVQGGPQGVPLQALVEV